MTNEQKKMNREYTRLEKAISHAKKGQDFLHRQVCNLPEQYHAARYADYAKYQEIIDRCEKRMAEMRDLAAQMTD